ncbi:MAG: hypothetical protein WBL61_19460 [Bryobacteraceae bacterium]
MRGFKPSRCVFGLFAAAILASGIAAADTIEVTSVGLGDSGIYIDEDIDGTLTPTDVYFAGIIDIQLTDSSGTYDRTTMCVQLLTDINLGTVYNTTVVAPSQATVNSPTTNGALEQIAWLLDNVTPTTGDQAAGLQLAIWKIAEDGVDTGSNLTFTSGTVQQATGGYTTPAAVLSYATTYLAASVGNASDLAYVYENASTGNPPTAAQMLEGLEYQDGGPAPVAPESSTFVLAGVALLALGHTARRKLGSR